MNAQDLAKEMRRLTRMVDDGSMTLPEAVTHQTNALKSYARSCVEDYQEELDNHLVANGWASIVGEFDKVDILTP